ncbi:hypothetical protein [Alkalihalobacillus sp. R86527]
MTILILTLFLLLAVPVMVVSKKINEHDMILKHRQHDRTGIK